LENIYEFVNNPDCRVYIGHPMSGGIGVNLVVAAYSIFFSRTFSLEQYLQARARNHRGGTKEAGHLAINHYDLVCENTIDELAQQKLAGKLDMSARLLGDLVKEISTQ
jgi:SNF2 family DNA or RNA helicase